MILADAWYHEILVLLLLVYGGGYFLVRQARSAPPEAVAKRALDGGGGGSGGDGAEKDGFAVFQRNYLCVYGLVMYSDWLKGPYVYALYDSYGFNKKEIADLFVAGFLSSLLCGTYCGALADKVGRRRMSLVFCATYALSALTKVVSSYWVLMLGRVLAGVATSLLTTVFESWMVSEHTSRGYPPRLLDATFARATAPFLLAVGPLWLVSCIVLLTWSENYGSRQAFSFRASLDVLVGRRGLVYLGLSQSCFEAAMFTWVFLWTPVLTTPETKATLPYGVIFAAFMVCIMVGSLVFEACSIAGSLEKLPYLMHAAALGTALVPLVLYESKGSVFASFLAFEVACGVFFPLYGVLRARHLPEASRASLSNFFRFPMNLLVVVFLLGGAQKSNQQGFFLLAATHAAGLFFYRRFDVLSRQSAQSSCPAGGGGLPT
eukprot:Rhum_TRINITY_DN15452_c4_g2::Rhum_TRINITY_DN15452_c4_g2_i1::g.157679::m.157679